MSTSSYFYLHPWLATASTLCISCIFCSWPSSSVFQHFCLLGSRAKTRHCQLESCSWICFIQVVHVPSSWGEGRLSADHKAQIDYKYFVLRPVLKFASPGTTWRYIFALAVAVGFNLKVIWATQFWHIMPIGIIPAPAAVAGAKSVRDSCNLICLPGYSGSRSSSSSVLHKFQHRRRRCLLLLPSFKWFTLFGLKVYQLGKCIYLIHTQTGAADWQTEGAGKASRQGRVRQGKQVCEHRLTCWQTDGGTDIQTEEETVRQSGQLWGSTRSSSWSWSWSDALGRKLNDCAHEVTQHSNAHFTPFSKVCLRQRRHCLPMFLLLLLCVAGMCMCVCVCASVCVCLQLQALLAGTRKCV